jgi:hypothetical protein
VVQRRLAELLATAPPGPIRIISICAGRGHDLLGVVPTHARRDDVTSVLVEIDPVNAGVAREGAARAGLTRFQVIEADAALTDVYAHYLPADIALACGIFGNISDVDLERTVRGVSMLGRTGMAVIWTRHRLDPDLTPTIRRWFRESGFQESSFDALETENRYAIGVARLVRDPAPFTAELRLFTFTR